MGGTQHCNNTEITSTFLLFTFPIRSQRQTLRARQSPFVRFGDVVANNIARHLRAACERLTLSEDTIAWMHENCQRPVRARTGVEESCPRHIAPCSEKRVATAQSQLTSARYLATAIWPRRSLLDLRQCHFPCKMSWQEGIPHGARMLAGLSLFTHRTATRKYFGRPVVDMFGMSVVCRVVWLQFVASAFLLSGMCAHSFFGVFRCYEVFFISRVSSCVLFPNASWDHSCRTANSECGNAACDTQSPLRLRRCA